MNFLCTTVIVIIVPSKGNNNALPFYFADYSSKKYSNSNPDCNGEPITSSDKFVYKNITVKKKTLFVGLLVAIIAILVFIIGIIVWTTQSQSKNYYYKLGDGDDDRKNIPIESTIGREIECFPNSFLSYPFLTT